MIEEPLGGNISASVRVGDTVRRRAGPWTPAIYALLKHLHTAGFEAAPEPLGIDEEGRAMLRFVEGDTHPGWPDPMPAWMYEDPSTLEAAARLLRRYHEAAMSFTPPGGAQWRVVAPVKHEVICHYDWAPYNAIFRGHEPVVMLDWDSAGPGSRMWDLAVSAYQWIPLYTMHDGVSHNPVLPLSRRAARLAIYCRAYGGVRTMDAVDALIDELPFHAANIERLADSGDAGYEKLTGWDVPARLRMEAELLRAERAELIADAHT